MCIIKLLYSKTARNPIAGQPVGALQESSNCVCVCGRDECAGECCEGVDVGVGDPVLHTTQ